MSLRFDFGENSAEPEPPGAQLRTVRRAKRETDERTDRQIGRGGLGDRVLRGDLGIQRCLNVV